MSPDELVERTQRLPVGPRELKTFLRSQPVQKMMLTLSHEVTHCEMDSGQEEIAEPD